MPRVLHSKLSAKQAFDDSSLASLLFNVLWREVKKRFALDDTSIVDKDSRMSQLQSRSVEILK